MPKILRDTQRDCGKPGCRNDYHMQVLARGDEMIGQERRLPPCGTKQTFRATRSMSAFAGKADMRRGTIAATLSIDARGTIYAMMR